MRHRPHHHSGRSIGGRLFGFLFFLLFVSAVVGGLISWALAPGRFGFLLLGFGIVVLVGFTIARAFRRNWSPISQLIDATTALGDGQNDVRLPETRGPWAAVSMSFNNMASRLETNDEQRRRLLADLSHELRTPLTVVRGQIEAVLDGLHGPESLANVVDEVGLMDRLLDDLRTLSEVEAGQLDLAKEPTDLGALVSETVASFQSIADGVGVELRVANHGGRFVEADAHRVHQIISNLVANAINAMPEGGILTVESTGGTVVVMDTGPGLSEGQVESVFDRFEKAADSKGSGLGLSIARDLARAHGGDLTAENGVSGARFTLTLPA